MLFRSFLALRQCRTLRWLSPSALRCRDIMVSTTDRSLHTPKRRQSLLTGRRTKGIRPCFSTSAVRYYGNTPWVSRFFRDIRLLFYCGDVMIIVTGPYTCGAVMNHRAVVLSICPGVMRVKRETGQKPVRARHCRSGVHEHCPSQTDSHWQFLPGRRLMCDDG